MTPLFDMSKLRAAVPQHVVERALALIDPKPDQSEACAEEVRTHVALLRMVATDLASVPKPYAVKLALDEKRKIGAALRRLQAVIRSDAFAVDLLFKTSGMTVEAQQTFLAQLERLADAAEFASQALVVRRPSRHEWNNTKVITARYADKLLRAFGTRRPTKSAGIALASLLYEEATGKESGEFSTYFRDLDRIKPEFVLKGFIFEAPCMPSALWFWE
jgi:hypothetical protein